jgi:hypothetical protein
MYVFSLFAHSARLEMAITELQMKGIPKEAILAVPLDRRNEGRMLFDTTHSSDSASMMALPMILAMMLTLFGAVIGFQLIWGPVVWAFIGAAAGFLLGVVLRLVIALLYKQRQSAQHKAGVVLLVRCDADQTQMAQDILWSNAAMGVSKLSM